MMGLRERRILYASAFLRAVAVGALGVLLGLHLACVGFDESGIGLVATLGLAGTAGAALVATFRGEAIGRRRLLVLLGVLGALGAVGVAFGSDLRVIGAAALLGMVNAAGRDRGASLALEQSLLPETVDDLRRTAVFARYNVVQDLGHALGALGAGLPKLLFGEQGVTAHATVLRGGVAATGLLLLVAGSVALALPRDSRVAAGGTTALTPATRRVLLRIGALFGLDSLGGGFLTSTLVGFWFFRRFGVEEGQLGLLFAAARVLNALSHLAAAALARRIGLVRTMVFTHLPSSLLLASVAFAPNFPVAALLFLLREGLVEMDVPTRQSYVMAVVRPHERTQVAGITTIVRLFGAAGGPVLAGAAMAHVAPAAPLFVGAGLKVAYDLLLFLAFRREHPPEERRQAPPP